MVMVHASLENVYVTKALREITVILTLNVKLTVDEMEFANLTDVSANLDILVSFVNFFHNVPIIVTEMVNAGKENVFVKLDGKELNVINRQSAPKIAHSKVIVTWESVSVILVTRDLPVHSTMNQWSKLSKVLLKLINVNVSRVMEFVVHLINVFVIPDIREKIVKSLFPHRVVAHAMKTMLNAIMTYAGVILVMVGKTAVNLFHVQ